MQPYGGIAILTESVTGIRMPKARHTLEAQFDNAVVRGQLKSVRRG